MGICKMHLPPVSQVLQLCADEQRISASVNPKGVLVDNLDMGPDLSMRLQNGLIDVSIL